MKDFEIDAYTPAQMASRVEKAGIVKSNLDFISTLILSIMAGAFIAFGAVLYTNVRLTFPFAIISALTPTAAPDVVHCPLCEIKNTTAKEPTRLPVKTITQFRRTLSSVIFLLT